MPMEMFKKTVMINVSLSFFQALPFFEKGQRKDNYYEKCIRMDAFCPDTRPYRAFNKSISHLYQLLFIKTL